jgi:hypothetical protein
MADFETNPAEETKNPVQKITANGVTEREKTSLLLKCAAQVSLCRIH